MEKEQYKPDKEQQKRENTIRFIEATQQLIDEVGMENVSIRKIAEKAGFHNSTIYLYFKDVDQLFHLASLKHFAEYSRALSDLDTKKLSATENLFHTWSFFADTVLRTPNLFYNFFYGKYSDDLSVIMKQYYALFPEEEAHYSDVIEDMYYGKNIHERCLVILKPMIAENNRITEDNVEMINDIIVSYLKTILEMKAHNQELDSEELKTNLLNAIRFIIGVE